MDDARLRWLLRRGMKELDVVVGRYHQRRYAAAPSAEKSAFHKLLSDVEDPDLWSWVMGHAVPPAEFAELIDELRRHD